MVLSSSFTAVIDSQIGAGLIVKLSNLSYINNVIPKKCLQQI